MYTQYTCARCGRMIFPERGSTISFMPIKHSESTYYYYANYNSYVVCPDCTTEIKAMINNQTPRLKYTPNTNNTNWV